MSVYAKKIKLTRSSLAIEANSLSLTQVRDAIEGKIVFGPQKKKFRKKRVLTKPIIC
jgi:Fic family protein